jgi:hypothetical protein
LATHVLKTSLTMSAFAPSISMACSILWSGVPT